MKADPRRSQRSASRAAGPAAQLELNDLSSALRSLRAPSASGLPRYQRLASALTEAVKRGALRAGDRLPPEEELTRMSPYSLGTVQRALRVLADQGLVVRRHGLGNFIADENHPLELQGPWQFLDDDGNVLPIYATVLDRQKVAATPPVTRHLGPDTHDLMRVDRLFSVDNEFNFYNRFYAHAELLPLLWKMPINELHGLNFTHMIASKCRVPITEITHLIALRKADPDICEILQISQRQPVMHVQAVAKAGKEIGVYYQEFVMPPTRRPLRIVEKR